MCWCELGSVTDGDGTATEHVTSKHRSAGTYRLHLETGPYFHQRGMETLYPHVDVSIISAFRLLDLYIIRGLARWARGVDGRGSGGRHHTGSKQRAWTDDVRRPSAGAGEGEGTAARLRRAAKPQSSVHGRSGRRASRRPKSSRAKIVCSAILAGDCYAMQLCQKFSFEGPSSRRKQ